MGPWPPVARRVSPRVVVALLTLVSHLTATLWFALPAPSHAKPAGVAYPCQARPCGCVTSERCWAGDCCCFTLEQKVAWAEANGVAVPGHVRPLVTSRQARPKPAVEAAPDCPHCASEAAGRQQATRPTPAPAGVRWVAGVFARHCRGDGAAGGAPLDPAVASAPAPVVIAVAERTGRTVPRSVRTVAVTHTPPTRPPRLS